MKLQTIILAGGKGTRMESDLPKVLIPFGGKTLVEYAIQSVLDAKISSEIALVTGYGSELVKETLKSYPVSFIHQSEQLGTGHAVKICRDSIDQSLPVLVLYGDHALIQPQTIEALVDLYAKEKPEMALVTYDVPNYGVYDGMFWAFGRIIRDKNGMISAIRELKDATDSEQQIKEVNPAYFLFNGPWLWDQLDQLTNTNAQNEYYLTDLLQIAIGNGDKVVGVKGQNLQEAIGVNTKEHLALAEQLISSS